MIPEFIGRLPVVTSTKQLDEADLIKVLTEPKNSLVRQYQHLFDLDDVKLEFTNEALHEIAKLANERGTGARALSSILEKTLSDIMFEVPSMPQVGQVTVTSAVVTGGADPEYGPRQYSENSQSA